MGYIARHWHGENSLAFAYWINAVLLQFIIGMGFVYLSQQTQIFGTPLRVGLGLTFIAAVTVWALVGVWRSAGNSIRQANQMVPSRTAIWAYIARFMVLVGFLQSIVTLGPLFQDTFEAHKINESAMATEFNLFIRGETDVVLEGYLNPPAVAAVKEAFEDNERANVLVVSSPGGFLRSAFELADIVEERDLSVVVERLCHSSCVLLLAASRNRFVTPDSDIALHDPGAAGKFASKEMIDVVQDERREFYSRMRAYGFSAAYLDQLVRKKWINLTIEQAMQLGLADYLWEPIAGEIIELRVICGRVDCNQRPLVLQKPLASYR
jgi:ATP-dependent protease ClpP protease subunit